MWRQAVTFYKQIEWVMCQIWHVQRWSLLGLLLVALLSGVLPAGVALTTRGLVDAIVMQVVANSAELTTILIWLAAAFLFALSTNLLASIQNHLAQRLILELKLHFTLQVMNHAGALAAEQLENPFMLDLTQTVRNRALTSASTILLNLLAAATALLQVISLVVILVWIEPFVAPLILLAACTVLWSRLQVTHDLIQERHRRATRKRWQTYFLSLLLNYESAFEVRLLGLSSTFIKRYQAIAKRFIVFDRQILQRLLKGELLFTTLALATTFGLIIRLLRSVLLSTQTLGDVTIFLGSASRLSRNLQRAVSAGTAVYEQTTYLAILRQLLAIESQQTVSSITPILPDSAPLILKNVSFAYPHSEQMVLQDISLHIKPGERVAIVGRNGAGKTTLVKLIAGLYRPTSGQICYGEYAIDTLSSEQWFQQVSFVFQDFNRYEATVSENIAYGDWAYWESRLNNIVQVAHTADTHQLVTTMPNQYDTLLGRKFGNYKPSGGEWQKIAIARAFAKQKGAILIFDEPSAHLDAGAEHKLLQQLNELAFGRTTIFISHRFSNVQMADRIFVLAAGRLIEQGTHAELMQLNGEYATLYKIQSTRFDII